MDSELHKELERHRKAEQSQTVREENVQPMRRKPKVVKKRRAKNRAAAKARKRNRR